MKRLRSFTVLPLTVPLSEPFGIATGAHAAAENVFVRLELEDGSVGYGEAAPVPHISGESQGDVVCALSEVESLLLGRNLAGYRAVCEALDELVGPTRSALSAVEIALFDALCKSMGTSMADFFGGATKNLEIDVTITTGGVQEARRAAQLRAAGGFRVLKVKVGGADIDTDAQRICAICEAAPEASLILDGNTAYIPSEAVSLLASLGPHKERIVAFEQPVARDDWHGLGEVEAKCQVAVIADESLRSRDDFRRLLEVGGVSGFNLKSAKLGLLTAWDLLVAAKALGKRVMVGGMVETEISMSASACLAAGVGGVDYVDLDTPLFLGARPTRGSIEPWGPWLDLSTVRTGHGAGFVDGVFGHDRGC